MITFTTYDPLHSQQGKEAVRIAIKHPRLQVVLEGPLGGNLKGLRRLRIGNYRVAYQVEENRVIIWAILYRKDIYREVARRYGG